MHIRAKLSRYGCKPMSKAQVYALQVECFKFTWDSSSEQVFINVVRAITGVSQVCGKYAVLMSGNLCKTDEHGNSVLGNAIPEHLTPP